MPGIRKIIGRAVFVIGIVSTLLYVYNWNNLSFGTKTKTLVYDTKNCADQSNQPVVNKTWTAIRNVLLSEQNVSKVIILAHARGGSTLCSDIFNIETNNTVLWYEALHGFHAFYSGVPHYSTDDLILYYANLTRRRADNAERSALVKYLTQLMTCDFENVPVELISINTFMNKSLVFKDFVGCTEQLKTFGRFVSCQQIINKYCFSEDLAGISTLPMNDSIVSSFKCAELLQSIRRLKSPPGNRLKMNYILRSYFSYQNNSDSRPTFLEQTIFSSCSQFMDYSGGKLRLYEDPPEWRKHCLNIESMLKAFIKYDQCLEDLHKGTLSCRQKMAAPCHRTRLTVAEFQRVFIEDLEPFIQQMPDIHVVHYVRDPRAVSVSRADKHIHTFRQNSSWTAVHETYVICQRMLYDIEHKKRLQQIYPGSIITVRYEDLVLNPKATVKRMYKFFGRPIPRGLDEWVKRTMQASKDDGMYGVQRRSGKRHLSEWRTHVNVDDIDIMNQLCLDVLKEYDYPLSSAVPNIRIPGPSVP